MSLGFVQEHFSGIGGDGRSYFGSGETPIKFSITEGSETANVIQLTIQAQDYEGNNVAAAIDAKIVIFSAAMLKLLVAAFHCGVDTGTAVSTDSQPELIFTTNASGQAIIDVTDVAGASGATVRYEVKPMARPGEISYGDITFD